MTDQIHSAKAETLRTTCNQHVHRAQELASAIVRRWNAGETPDAKRAIRDWPELSADASVAVDLAYEEYCQRVEHGESVVDADFCRRFSTFQTSLARRLEVHRAFASHQPRFRVDFPVPPCRLLNYDLHRELGRGGLGRVYLGAEKSVGDRLVVVKASFEQTAEAGILGNLDHPNIVKVNSVQQDPSTGLSVMCMPYLGKATLKTVLDALALQPGPQHMRSLSHACRQSRLDEPASPAAPVARKAFVDEVLSIALQIGDAIAHAHERNILHRDIKPSNVLMTPAGCPMVLDFNLSVEINGRTDRHGGTLPYMAPEQIRCIIEPEIENSRSVDVRSDVYSFGVLLFELFSGKLPFDIDQTTGMTRSSIDKMLALQLAGPPPLGEHCPGLSKSISAVVGTCMAFDPGSRPQSMRAVVELLAAQMRGVPLLRRRMVQRRKAVALTALALMAVAASVGSMLAMQPPAHARYIAAGELHLANRDYARAADAFQAALDRDPKSVPARLGRARVSQLLGDMPAAGYMYTAAYNRSRDGRTAASIGYCLASQSLHKPAVQWLKRAAQEGYGTAIVFNDLGLCAHRSRDLKGAIDYLNKAIKCDATLQAAYYNRAALARDVALAERSTIDERAISDVAAALKYGPATADLMYLGAWVWSLSDRTIKERRERAIEYLSRAVDLGFDPKSIATNGQFAFLQAESAFAHLFNRSSLPQPSAKIVRLLDPWQGDSLPPALAKR